MTPLSKKILTICLILFWATSTNAKTKNEFLNFDVYGIRLLDKKGYLNKDNYPLWEKMQKDISTVLDQNSKVQDSSLKRSVKLYISSMECSEMAGCSFELLQVPITCDAKHYPESDNGYDIIDIGKSKWKCVELKKGDEGWLGLTSKELHPSNKYPNIYIGKTTRESIIATFGVPYFQDSKKMVYLSDRDRKSEKDCGYDTKKGLFSGDNLIFFFNKAGILSGISLKDKYGEC